MPWVPPEKVNRVELRDFPGLVTRSDPGDVADGASRDQVNLTSQRPGELRLRPGYLPLTFQED